MKKSVNADQVITSSAKAAEYHRSKFEEFSRDAILEVDANLQALIKQFTVAGEYSQLQVLEGILKSYLVDINKFKSIIAVTLIQTDVELDPNAGKKIEAFKQFSTQPAQQKIPPQVPPQQKVR